MGIPRKRKTTRRNDKSDMEKPRIFYPKRFEGYVGLFTIFSILILILATAIIIVTLWNVQNRTLGKLLIVGIFTLTFYLVPIYMLLFAYKLSSKKIFLMVTSEKVMLKDTLKSKEIKFKDIEGIRRTTENIRGAIGGTGLQYIHIYAKKERDKSSSSQVWIRVSWFGKETICKFIDSVKEMQKYNSNVWEDSF